jgi:hypothetical protein
LEKQIPKIACTVPLTSAMTWSDFFISTHNLDTSGLKVKWFAGIAPRIDMAQNRCVEAALLWKPDYIMMFAADQTYPEDTIKRLLAWDREIVTGLVYQKTGFNLPCIWDIEGERSFHVMKTGEKVDYIGFAGALLKAKVFDTIPKPWFEDSLKHNYDTLFCLKCSNFDIPIYCDTTLEFGHLVVKEITRADMKKVTGDKFPAGYKWSKIDAT